MLNESGDEEESDQIVSQVLDEIGIEMSGKMSNVPSALKDTIGSASNSTNKLSEKDIEAQLARLRSS